MYPMFPFLAKKIKTNKRFLGLLVVLLAFASEQTCAQNKPLYIENGDLVLSNLDTNIEGQWLYKNSKGQAKLIQENTTIEADSTKYFSKKNYAEALGNVYINQADSIDIYSNQAFYFGNTRKAKLIGEVALLKDIYSLQTDELDYDLDKQIATYHTGGTLTDTVSTLTSIHGSYDMNKELAIFTDSVVLIDVNRKIITEKLTYYLNDKWAYFEGETTIEEDGQVIKTTKGKYNTETGQAFVEGNPVIEDDETFFSADLIEIDSLGNQVAQGNVNYRSKADSITLTSKKAEKLDEDRIKASGNVHIVSEKDDAEVFAGKAIINRPQEEFQGRENVRVLFSSQQTELLSDSLDVFQKRGYAIAQGRPFLTSVQDSDSIFMIANTMEAIRQNDADSTYNFILNQQVKIFKSDLQAIADSVYVNNIDSTIVLYKDPVIWSDSTQITADTITIFIRNQQVDSIQLRKNCFFVNLVEDGLYNQMKGQSMDVYMKNEQVDSLFVDKNAETIYYVLDEENAYVGIDKMKSGQTKVNFEEGRASEIYWYKQQEGETHPFQDVNPSEFLLQGFRWRILEKPLSKDYLLIASGRKEGELPAISENSNKEKQSDEIKAPVGLKGINKKK